jgi:hypothetical protein
MDFIDKFEAHYDYDCNYMRTMRSSSADGFKTFVDFMPMGQYSKALDNETQWVSRIAAMLTEDCGGCVQLNIKMAIEAGVDKELVRTIILSPENLESNLKLVYDYSKSVALNSTDHNELSQEIRKLYSSEQVTEFALAIAAAKVYPTLKRALGEFKSCALYKFQF